jgi:hypothetical protein
VSEQIISLPVIGDKIGTIIYEDTVDTFEGNVVFDNGYHSLPDFWKLELLNDVISVLTNEYERVTEAMTDEASERKAQKNSKEPLQ